MADKKNHSGRPAPSRLATSRADMPGIASSLGRHIMVFGGFALLTLLMFGGLLFSRGTTVFGNQGADLHSQFVAWRSFGFQELAKGNLALWNPHIYGGAPYFGGFQAALLYPPNLLYLALPLPQAINWGVALHVFLMGAFMYAWMKFRGLRPESGVLRRRAYDVWRDAFHSHIRGPSSEPLRNGLGAARFPRAGRRVCILLSTLDSGLSTPGLAVAWHV